jgi:hypothetical protein
MSDELHNDAVEGGNYDVIRARLVGQAGGLRTAANALNVARTDAFGASEMAVMGEQRVRTDNKCVPVDIVQVGGHLLFGYNVQFGLKQQVSLPDVLSLQGFSGDEGAFEVDAVTDEASLGFLRDRTLVREFDELYQYYKDARLIQLRVLGSKLLAVFQTGATAKDVKVLRWGLDGARPSYIDSRGERDHVFPPTHDFTWTPTGRGDHVRGAHPHVNILDTVFVETVGGDLTVKIEDNTDSGAGIYAEPVLDPNQSLDDAEISYAKLGSLILLAVKPYREDATRYLVYNHNTRNVRRIDAIGQSCVQLPEDHGILFPGGYYLGTGEAKVFDADLAGLEFVQAIAAPNGEDLLYVFHRRSDGLYALYPYNLVRKDVATPIHAHGYSLFDDGRLVVFRATAEAVRVHPMQVWKTPFVSDEHHESIPNDGSLLARVGNRELVRGISDAFTICRLVDGAEPSRQVFEEIIAACTRFVDAYFWANAEEVGDLRARVVELRRTAELIVDEFEKVQVLQRRATEVLAKARRDHDRLLTDTRHEYMRDLSEFMAAMTALRTHRGQVISLREVRYVDLEVLQTLEDETVARFDAVSKATVAFLIDGDAYGPVRTELDELLAEVEGVAKVVELAPLQERLETASAGVNLLSEVVAGLEVDDPTRKAEILGELSEVFASANRVRAVLDGRREQLASKEDRAEFVAQFKLFEQAIAGSLARCDTPEATDEELSRLLLQLEELEGRFGEFDTFLADLSDKREQVYEAFTARKQALLEARQKRIEGVLTAADRILGGVERRARSFKQEDELNAWFAADPMVMKLRQLAEQLGELGDNVRADEVLGRLKTARQDALRGLRDRLELFDGDDLVKLGRHRFSVNKEALELTLVQRSSELMVHLTGTDFYEPVVADGLDSTRVYWDQPLVSESSDVYRGEYLAASILFDAEAGREGSLAELETAVLSEEALVELVRRYAASRIDEGYDRGIHDVDAAKVLAKLVGLRQTAGVLRFPAPARVLAVLYRAFAPELPLDAWTAEARALGRLRDAFGPSEAIGAFGDDLGARIAAWHTDAGFASSEVVAEHAATAGAYLFEELARADERYTFSAAAQRLRDGLNRWLEDHGGEMRFEDALRPLADLPARRFAVKRAFLRRYAATEDPELVDAAEEAAALLLAGKYLDHEVSSVPVETEVPGLLGRHARVTEGTLSLRFDQFMDRLRAYREVTVPGWRAWRRQRQELLESERHRLRIDELQPRVMTSFVRNQLINDVYLHIVGDNLAKQMGAAGDDKRTDLMGLLLLVSPPGYGKTTLMEYVASRLGLVFVKVNGPALGHDVKSLDPAEAPNATARQEVEKINLAFEMGNNVMLYLDDIQHTHPELLQKFISLCDGQRRIEGVWKDRTRTYDLRGKKFCVVMAGNPYTESGDKFQIPDMLANRADTYNLGDVLSGREGQFAMSFLENAITSNPALAPLATRPQSDTYLLVRRANGEEIPMSELSHDYSAVELDEITGVLTHLFRCREVLLKVNETYVRSAAMEEAFRTEPRFQLQGSYRNMNKLAEKLVPAMTEAEVEALITDHYVGEAQTLTSGAEANLLKLGELRGTLDADAQERWDALRKEFRRLQLMGGGDDDPAARISGVLSGAVEELGRIAGRMEHDSVAPLSSELSALREAVVASSERDPAASIRESLDALRTAVSVGPSRLGAGLDAIREALDKPTGRGPEALIGPLHEIADRLERAPAPPPESVQLADLLAELREIRATLARGVPAQVTTQVAAARATPSRSEPRVGEAEKQAMLAHAQAVLEGRAMERPEGEPLMVAAVEVIEALTMKIVGTAQRRVPAEEREGLMVDVRRVVANAVKSLAESRT